VLACAFAQAPADSRLPERENKLCRKNEEETLRKKNWGTTNHLLKLHHNKKKILARNPLDKIPIAQALVPSACGFGWAIDTIAEVKRYRSLSKDSFISR
jgi:hypothetical protein